MKDIKSIPTILTVIAVVGGLYAGLLAMDARFVPHAFAANMIQQIQAITKRLDIKIHEDKIDYAERERWEATKRYGRDSTEVERAQAKIDRLKRTGPK